MNQVLYTSEILNCQYDAATGIFYKFYSGSVEFDDIVHSWNEIIENGLIPEKTHKFLLDYSKANYVSGPETARKIAQFYKQNQRIFSGAKIALIMQRPNQVIFPILVDAECAFMSVKPFYTLDAARNWLD